MASRKQDNSNRLSLLDRQWEKTLGARVVGIDEVGRGALAGPLVTAAVILPSNISLVGVNDSKKLSLKQRLAAYNHLINGGCQWSLGFASCGEIDKYNIRQATLLAMTRALAMHSSHCYDFILIDGCDIPPGIATPVLSVVKGDSISPSIAAASIIAKVMRDIIMEQLSQTYSSYGWQTNRGYATATHRRALAQNGPSPHHRFSFLSL